MSVAGLLLLIVAAIVVAGLSKRYGFQVPLVLVTVGAAVSFVPGVPPLVIDPDLILGVVLPPLLYSAALDFSFTTFRRNIWPILRLGIGMVVVTAAAVGVFANWLVPELTLGAALVLGAVVAPPDAVAAVAVGRKLGLPERMMAILKGESLVNDASALTLFTLAVAAVTGRRIAIDSPIAFFAYEIAGGVLVGCALALLVRMVRARITDPALETVLGLLLPFTAYLAAEEIHASGVLAVVAAGFAMGRVLAAQADPGGQPSGPERAETDQADTGDRPAVDQLRSQRRRHQAGGEIRVDPVVHEESSFDDAGHPRRSHPEPLSSCFAACAA